MSEKAISPLPSQAAAQKLLAGEPGALGEVAMSMAFRAALISVGLYAAGIREDKTLVKGAAFGAMAIEAFVLGYTWFHREKS